MLSYLGMIHFASNIYSANSLILDFVVIVILQMELTQVRVHVELAAHLLLCQTVI